MLLKNKVSGTGDAQAGPPNARNKQSLLFVYEHDWGAGCGRTRSLEVTIEPQGSYVMRFTHVLYLTQSFREEKT